MAELPPGDHRPKRVEGELRNDIDLIRSRYDVTGHPRSPHRGSLGSKKIDKDIFRKRGASVSSEEVAHPWVRVHKVSSVCTYKLEDHLP